MEMAKLTRKGNRRGFELVPQGSYRASLFACSDSFLVRCTI